MANWPRLTVSAVLGFTPWRRQNDFKRQFALILGQKNQLWWDLPASESLELNRVIYAIDKASAQKTIDELTELRAILDASWAETLGLDATSQGLADAPGGFFEALGRHRHWER